MEELLERCGLDRYIPTFRAEEIDLEVLSLVDDHDLQELGLPKGPRIKLLKAIAGLMAGKPPPQQLEALEARMTSYDGRLADALAAAKVAQSELELAQARLTELEKMTAAQSNTARTQMKQLISASVGSQVSSMGEDVRGLYTTINSLQELAPHKVLWNIRNFSEKLRNLPPGKHLRAPAFAVCGFLSGIKLDFYPQGRQDEEGALPEITPRPSLQGDRRQSLQGRAGYPSTSTASVALCMPMGIKIQYHLQIGRQHTIDSRFADWTWVFHDMRIDWQDELQEDDALTIMFCVAKLHNRRYMIEGDTVFVRSD
jgi:hypothetical protein